MGYENMRKLKVERNELKKLTTNLDDTNGGTTWACATVSIGVAVTLAVCPTTKCTSRCR